MAGGERAGAEAVVPGRAPCRSSGAWPACCRCEKGPGWAESLPGRGFLPFGLAARPVRERAAPCPGSRIGTLRTARAGVQLAEKPIRGMPGRAGQAEIGRASCRERQESEESDET